MSPESLEIIRRALAEDLGSGDVTSESFIPQEHRASARLLAKEDAIVAGLTVVAAVFQQLDPNLTMELPLADGSPISSGTIVLTATGPTRTLLAAERTALNFLQRLSGIATRTHQFIDAVAGTGVIILDTRKTTPGLRQFERLAVRAGGGTNHRFGLFDRLLAKDNHLAVTPGASGIQAAIDRAKLGRPDILIEIEADNLEQVSLLCQLPGVDIILLDNMSNGQMEEAVRIRGNKNILLEASGGIKLDTVRAVAQTGVDQISVGSLTHSARAIDFSMEIS